MDDTIKEPLNLDFALLLLVAATTPLQKVEHVWGGLVENPTKYFNQKVKV